MDQPIHAKNQIPLELPLVEIHAHPGYVSHWVEAESKSLMSSVASVGILVPLLVMTIGDDAYHIIDGHRRFWAARRLGFVSVMCIVRPEISDGDVAVLRFQLHDTAKPCTAEELSQQRKRMKS